MRARIAQSVKAWFSIVRIAGSSLTVEGVFFWYGPLASLSPQIASVFRITTLKNGGSNRWIRVKITPRLFRINLLILVKCSRILSG